MYLHWLEKHAVEEQVKRKAKAVKAKELKKKTAKVQVRVVEE